MATTPEFTVEMAATLLAARAATSRLAGGLVKQANPPANPETASTIRNVLQKLWSSQDPSWAAARHGLVGGGLGAGYGALSSLTGDEEKRRKFLSRTLRGGVVGGALGGGGSLALQGLKQFRRPTGEEAGIATARQAVVDQYGEGSQAVRVHDYQQAKTLGSGQIAAGANVIMPDKTKGLVAAGLGGSGLLAAEGLHALYKGSPRSLNLGIPSLPEAKIREYLATGSGRDKRLAQFKRDPRKAVRNLRPEERRGLRRAVRSERAPVTGVAARTAGRGGRSLLAAGLFALLSQLPDYFSGGK